MDFRELLSDLLYEKNKSKMDLSKEAQIPYTTVCGWANGRLPDFNAIIKLSKYFNVTTDYLLGRENDGAESTSAPTQPRDELILLQAYRAMSPGKKKALFNMLDLDEDIVQRKKETS